MKTFPIPVVALGPGTQAEDETLNYLSMPADMDTYRPPLLPEPEAVAGRTAVHDALCQVLALLERAADTGEGGAIDLMHLGADDLPLVNQIMGEGEACAMVSGEDADEEIRAQESVFTGVWRVLTLRDGARVADKIEVGAIPALVRSVAAVDAQHPPPAWRGPLPAQVQNAPMLVTELQDQVARWQAGTPAHVINLSLLPVTPEDIAYLDHTLGTGRVLLLSRGYGNCRITNTRWPHCWRVVYYNSMDKVILNTVEVCDVPDVALAAPEDLRDSHERLQDILGYLEQA